jgi:hypothetical protein
MEDNVLDSFFSEENIVNEPQEENTPVESQAQEEPQEEPQGTQPEVETPTEEPQPEVEQPTEEPETQEPLTLNEEVVLNYLKENGVEVESFDSLKQDKNVFANEYIESLNKFMSETGRGIDEYNFVQQDLSSLPEQDLVKQQMKVDNPWLEDRQIDILYKDKYGLKSIDEDAMTDDEIAEAKRHNELTEIRLKQDGHKARESFASLQNEFKLPSQQQSSQPQEDVFDAEGFKKSFMDEAGAIESISFDVGKDKTFEFSLDENTQVEPVTPDEFLGKYKNEDGSWNTELFATHNLVLNNLDKIVAAAAAAQRSEGKEEVVRDLKNVNLEPRENNTQQPSGGLEELASILTSNDSFQR